MKCSICGNVDFAAAVIEGDLYCGAHSIEEVGRVVESKRSADNHSLNDLGEHPEYTCGYVDGYMEATSFLTDHDDVNIDRSGERDGQLSLPGFNVTPVSTDADFCLCRCHSDLSARTDTCCKCVDCRDCGYQIRPSRIVQHAAAHDRNFIAIPERLDIKFVDVPAAPCMMVIRGMSGHPSEIHDRIRHFRRYLDSVWGVGRGLVVWLPNDPDIELSATKDRVQHIINELESLKARLEE